MWCVCPCLCLCICEYRDIITIPGDFICAFDLFLHVFSKYLWCVSVWKCITFVFLFGSLYSTAVKCRITCCGGLFIRFFIRIMFAATESSKWTCLQGFFILLVDSQHLLWHFVYNVYIIINGGLDAVLMRRIESLQKKTERKRMAVQCSYVHIIVVYCVVFYENDDIE